MTRSPAQRSGPFSIGLIMAQKPPPLAAYDLNRRAGMARAVHRNRGQTAAILLPHGWCVGVLALEDLPPPLRPPQYSTRSWKTLQRDDHMKSLASPIVCLIFCLLVAGTAEAQQAQANASSGVVSRRGERPHSGTKAAASKKTKTPSNNNPRLPGYDSVPMLDSVRKNIPDATVSSPGSRVGLGLDLNF
jgi:hypothetical protein